MHLTAPSHWSRSIGTGGRDVSESVVTIVGMRSMGIPGGFGRARVLVTERYAVVGVVADRLYQRPPLGDIAEPGPCNFRETICFAIAAAEQIDQGFHRQRLQRML